LLFFSLFYSADGNTMGNTGWTNLLGHSTQLLDVATSFTALPALAPAMPLARIAELQQLLQLRAGCVT
jgi:hypothetical protein